jgi:prepilin peptidase CpaA
MQALSAFAGYLVVGAFAGLAAWAAYTDYARYIIPNRLCLAIAALYPGHVIAAPIAVDWLGGLATAAALLALGLVLFALRWSGGGDVKFLAAVGLWAGPKLILTFILVTALAGGVISIVTAARLRFAHSDGAGARPTLGQLAAAHVPYGIAIAAGALYVASQLLTGWSRP